MSKKASNSGRPSPFRNRKVWLPVAVVAAVVGYYAFTWWQEGAERAARRQRLLESCATELARPEPDADALSRLMAGLQRLPDADTSPEVLARRAEIELVRGRAERAFELFGSIASNPTATDDQARLGARILLRRSEAFAGDRSEWTDMLAQVASLSERAFGSSGDVADLFRCWQGSKRGFDDDASKRFADLLKGQFGDSPQARLVEVVAAFDPVRDRAPLRELANEFVQEPAELDALLAVTRLGAGDVEGAVDAVEKVLLRAPGVPLVRYAAAVVLHARAKAAEGVGQDASSWSARRDQQIDWLVPRVPPTDPLQATLRAMRQQ